MPFCNLLDILLFFHLTSTFEDNWERGSKILFVGIDEKGGMVSRIADCIPNQFISI
jgi:hypothetical protein